MARGGAAPAVKTNTKTDTIKALLEAGDLTRKEIAARVGCLPAYVRVVQQRLNGNCAARRWRARNLDRERFRCRRCNKERYATDLEYRERCKASARRRYQERKARQQTA